MPATAKTSVSHPLMVNHVTAPGGGVIGMTICPGKKQRGGAAGDWDRDLGLDLGLIRDWGAVAVVTLMEADELGRYGAAEIGGRVESLGMEWHHLPIVDVSTPAPPFAGLWAYSGVRLRGHLAAGRRILLHCRGGLGRTGMIAAALLVESGLTPGEAIAAVRAARPGTIETGEQERYVRAVRKVDAAADRRAGRLLGCLLGGAVGDGFGYAVEFDKLAAIRQLHGPAGLQQPVFRAGRLVVSDDTQMTLFTLEGLGRAVGADGAWQADAAVSEVRRAYLDWLDTQRGGAGGKPAGQLVGRPELRVERAPGVTCTGALKQGGTGSIAEPINDSKGCGGAMRTAPVAFLPGIDAGAAFALGARLGALTHGHPDGWGSSGMVPATIRRLLDGVAPADAIRGAAGDLRHAAQDSARPPTAQPYENALKLAATGGEDAPTQIARLGEGWTGEEAVAIAAYAFLTGRDFRDVVARAANHDGDSDSTASIAGQFWGAAHGLDGVPHAWIRRLDVFEAAMLVATAPAWQRAD